QKHPWWDYLKPLWKWFQTFWRTPSSVPLPEVSAKISPEISPEIRPEISTEVPTEIPTEIAAETATDISPEMLIVIPSVTSTEVPPVASSLPATVKSTMTPATASSVILPPITILDEIDWAHGSTSATLALFQLTGNFLYAMNHQPYLMEGA